MAGDPVWQVTLRSSDMGVGCCGRMMQSVLASLLVGSERQEIRLRLTDDTLYVDKQELSYSSSCLPHELQADPTLLTKVAASY